MKQQTVSVHTLLMGALAIALLFTGFRMGSAVTQDDIAKQQAHDQALIAKYVGGAEVPKAPAQP